MINEARHSSITIIKSSDNRPEYIQKSYGLVTPIPHNIAPKLVCDYQHLESDLVSAGIPIARAVGINIEPSLTGVGKVIRIRQPYFQRGTALDQMCDRDSLGRMVSAVGKQILIPTFNHYDPRVSAIDSFFSLDAALKNFCMTNEGGLVYIDLWAPRRRDQYGNIVHYPNYHQHTITESQARYRFFSKIGILHNFVRKTLADARQIIPGEVNYASSSLTKEFGDYIRCYFGSKTSIEVIDSMPFPN